MVILAKLQIMDDNVHQPSLRQEIEEKGRPSRGEPEQLGPELRGKSLAEIAAILMSVPGPGGDRTAAAHSCPPDESRRSSVEGSQRMAVTQARATPASAPKASSGPEAGDVPAAPSLIIDKATPATGFVNAPPMAPGIGGPNIELPPLTTRPVDDAIASSAARRSPDWGSIPTSPIPAPPKTVARGSGRFLLGLTLSAIIVGLALFLFLNSAGKRPVADTVIPPMAVSHAKIAVPPARLLVDRQKGFVNERLPLGVSLDGGTGGEALTLSGLALGSKLSAGTPIGASVWRLWPRDLDQAFAYAPKDFVGVMDTAIDLRSADDELIDSQVVRFEWVERKDAHLAPQPSRTTPPPGMKPLDPVEVTMLIERATEFLKQGDIASARTFLRRAANAGSAQAALELGMTFDPALLAARGALGLVSDVAQAREWYERATKLGSPDAPRYLEQLVAASQ